MTMPVRCQENHFGEMDHPPLVCPVEGCGKQFIAQPLLTLHTANKHKKTDFVDVHEMF